MAARRGGFPGYGDPGYGDQGVPGGSAGPGGGGQNPVDPSSATTRLDRDGVPGPESAGFGEKPTAAIPNPLPDNTVQVRFPSSPVRTSRVRRRRRGPIPHRAG